MLIVISHSEKFKDEIDHFENLINEGVDFLHLRKPSLSRSELEKLILEIPFSLRKKISIHNHFDLAEKYDLGGIHFTEKSKQFLSEFSDSEFRISVSSHSFEDIKVLPDFVNYTFLSPVFDSISKQNYNGIFNSEKTKSFLETNFPFKVLALGGISKENIFQVKNLGFDGAALIGSVWNNPDYKSQICEIKKYV